MKSDMKIYLNHNTYAMIVPCDTLEAIGKPGHIRLLTRPAQHKLAICRANPGDAGCYDVPEAVYEGFPLGIQGHAYTETLRKIMSWGTGLYVVEGVAVPGGAAFDLDSASITRELVRGPFVCPRCQDE